jgi:molybdopterin biosynthesis enzyme
VADGADPPVADVERGERAVDAPQQVDEPLLAALLGRPSRCRPRPARLTTALPESGPRETWWRAELTIDASGQRFVTPDARRDSSLQRPLAAANALLRQPAATALASGDAVDALLID